MNYTKLQLQQVEVIFYGAGSANSWIYRISDRGGSKDKVQATANYIYFSSVRARAWLFVFKGFLFWNL